MAENVASTVPRNWRLPLSATIISFFCFLALACCRADTFLFLSVFVVAPVFLMISITAPIYAAFRNRRQFLPIVAALAVLWASSIPLFLYDREHPFAIRETARWLVWSHEYKQQVMAQPASLNGQLKHIEWDGSGFAGIANNTVYLVFDPADTLSAATTYGRAGTLNGIPCDVRGVRRLERQWYSVLLYTDQTWEQCK